MTMTEKRSGSPMISPTSISVKNSKSKDSSSVKQHKETSISVNRNKETTLRDKPKAGANRGKESNPIDPETDRKNIKADKLAARSAGKRKDPAGNENVITDRTTKGVKKKKKKKGGSGDDEIKKKTFKPKKPKQNFLLKFFLPQSDVILRDPRAIEAADALRLTQRHLRRLRDKFDAIDVDGSGNIDVDEFFEACDENKSPITDRLFALIDLDGSGTIEFDEYVRIMATYCMYTKDEILRFCFETFDKDGSNGIDEKEFMELCK
jgi:Ca2+-binding EF-hand superfamily protein